MVLGNLLAARQRPQTPRRVYDQIVAQARRPWFYADLGVGDTLQGRFDMIVLHAFLVFERLQGEDATAREFSQAVFDEMFADMDRSLRELGVSDIGVGKKVRRMAEVFYGRAAAYKEAAAAGRASLASALRRNVFEGGGTEEAVMALADYVLAQQKALALQPRAAIVSGDVRFDEAATESAHVA